jgi:membrane protease YdiL (CAAX protease family)
MTSYPGRTGSILDRCIAVVEVVAVFALVHVSYRAFKHFTAIGRLEGDYGLNFSAGATMILFTVAILLICRRSFEQYGLTLNGWKTSLSIGLFWGLLFAVAAVLVIRVASIHFDPLHPPDLKRSVAATIGELVNVFLLLWFLLRGGRALGRIPVWIGLLILFGLLLVPTALAVSFHRPVLKATLNAMWLFFGAGFGEEIFFRGYIQSRINQAFGRPYRWMNVEFGVGLIVSSVLFGSIHVLNTVDYFNGRYDFAWLWWLPSTASGLFFGFLREKTKSVVAGGVYHGLTDMLASIPALLP